MQNDQGVGDDARCRRLMHEAGRPIEEALRYARCAKWQVGAPPPAGQTALRLFWRRACSGALPCSLQAVGT